MAMCGKMQFVLHFGEKLAGRERVFVVVEGCGIDVGDFLMKLPLRKPYFTDSLELFLKIFLCQDRPALFQAFHIHSPALYRVLLDDLVCPGAKAYGSLVVDLETD